MTKTPLSSKSIATRAACAAALMLFGVGAQAQLSDVGTFGRSTYSSASTSYSPGRNMKWNGGDTFQAYCIDPYTGASFPGTYTQMSLDAFANGAATSSYAQQVTRSNYVNNLSPDPSTSAAAQSRFVADLKELFGWAYTDAATTGNINKAAAFGLVAWAIVLQDGGSTGTTYNAASGTGSFWTRGRANSSGYTAVYGDFGSTEAGSTDKVEYWVDQYIKALNGTVAWTTVLGASATLTDWTYTVYFDGVNPLSQTFISVKAKPPGDGGGQNVPEPISAALVGLAMAGLGWSRRRKGH